MFCGFPIEKPTLIATPIEKGLIIKVPFANHKSFAHVRTYLWYMTVESVLVGPALVSKTIQMNGLPASHFSAQNFDKRLEMTSLAFMSSRVPELVLHS